ncbi:MAG: hypothetical protein WAO19_13555 [Candidatus Kryptoniota bacterium]
MKIIIILSILCIFSFTYPTISTAQTDEWTVITSAKDTLRSCIIGTLEGDVVNLVCGSSAVQIPVDSLSILIRHKESHFWSGAGYGTLAGITVGVIVGLGIYEKPTGPWAIDVGRGGAALGGGILGAVAGFTIGGIVGAVFGGDEKYDLSQEPTKEKIKILRDLRGENR